jgi:tRNA(Ile)-lysidine synthase
VGVRTVSVMQRPMQLALRGLVKRDPAARSIVRSWRGLTSPVRAARAGKGEAVLVALSGGADSTGLLLALWASGAAVTAAHVVHDLRPTAEAEGDRQACRVLCERLGVPFVSARVSVKGKGGNAEAVARAERYAALVVLARAAGCVFVATGHHGQDQLETLLLALLRGSGPRGLAGIAASRRAGAVRVIRPALGVMPADLRRLCTLAGVAWREDATNGDTSLRRNRLRARVIPELLAMVPSAAARAVDVAELQHGAARLIAVRRPGDWSRATLRKTPAIVLGDALASKIKAISGRATSLAALRGVVRFIRSDSTARRVFSIGGCEVRVTSKVVEVAGLETGERSLS